MFGQWGALHHSDGNTTNILTLISYNDDVGNEDDSEDEAAAAADGGGAIVQMTMV